MVSAWAQQNNLVLGHVKSRRRKLNEIIYAHRRLRPPAIAKLLCKA